MANFTTIEKDLIKSQELEPEKRPSYYSRTSQSDQQIGKDFENFLILQNQTQKQKSIDWVNKALDIEADNEDRDALLETYFGIRQTDANERIEELDERLNDFNTFITGFFKDEASADDPDRFSNVPELSILIQSLQRPLAKMTIQRDIAFHESNLIGWLQEILKEEKTDENSRRELESWSPVISKYKGKSG